MKSANSGIGSATAAEDGRLELPGSPADSAALDRLRYAHPLALEDYLAFLTRWTEEWFPLPARTEGPVGFERPFELR